MRKTIFAALALSTLISAPAVAQTGGGAPEPQTTEPIVKRPQGRLVKNQARKALSFYSTGAGADVDSVDYYIGDYVVGDDGCVYLKNPFTFYPTQSYLKLDRLDGDTLVARMPQAIYQDEAMLYASRLVLKSGSQGMTYGYEQNADGTFNTDMRFLLRGDTLTLLGEDTSGDYPQAILGLATLSGNWAETGEAAFSVRPLGVKPTALPQGVTPQLYQLAYSGFYGEGTDLVEVAFADGKVYLSNPYNTCGMQWAVGNVAGNSVAFGPQYLGPNEGEGYHEFLCPGVYSETAEEYFELTDSLRFVYDDAAKTLSTSIPQSLLINVGDDRVYTAAVYIGPSLTPYTATADRPANPEITSYAAYGEEGEGEGSLQFELPSVDVNGQPLFKNNLYYKVYTASGKVLTFGPGQYESIEKEMTEVPYGMSDNVDFFMADDSHKFYFREAADSLGLQSVYKGERELCSDIVWTTGRTSTAIALPATRHEGTGEARYFDLQGRRLSGRQQGVCIRQRVLTDGRIVNEKTIQ